jgi:hypothetical protein
MNHLNEEDLVLHYYGEPGAAVAASHLAECGECAGRFHELQRALNAVDQAVVPERPDDYGAAVWRRIEGRLIAPTPIRRPRFRWQVWGSIAAMIALCLSAFWAGQRWPRSRALETASSAGGAVRQRVLVIALTDHFARSQMVLAELENAASPRAAGKLDVTYERAEAEDLLDANRLYRQTALSSGDMAAAALLDELERILVEIAHEPAQLDRSEVERLRSLIEEGGLTFKVRVFSSGLSAKGEL